MPNQNPEKILKNSEEYEYTEYSYVPYLEVERVFRAVPWVAVFVVF